MVKMESQKKDLLVHDETFLRPHDCLHVKPNGLSVFPVPMGVIRSIQRPHYEEMLHEQIQDVVAKKGKGYRQTPRSAETWEVK